MANLNVAFEKGNAIAQRVKEGLTEIRAKNESGLKNLVTAPARERIDSIMTQGIQEIRSISAKGKEEIVGTVSKANEELSGALSGVKSDTQRCLTQYAEAGSNLGRIATKGGCTQEMCELMDLVKKREELLNTDVNTIRNNMDKLGEYNSKIEELRIKLGLFVKDVSSSQAINSYHASLGQTEAYWESQITAMRAKINPPKLDELYDMARVSSNPNRAVKLIDELGVDNVNNIPCSMALSIQERAGNLTPEELDRIAKFKELNSLLGLK